MNFSLKSDINEGRGSTNSPAFLGNPMLYMIIGLALMLMMAVLLFSGSKDEISSTKAFDQGRRAVAQLSDSVTVFQQILQDEQVATLAEMAMKDPETRPELSQYLSGRISEFREARLFTPNAYLTEADEVGENAWIIIDMLMMAREHGIAPLQFLNVGGEPVVAGLVAFGATEKPAGYLMVMVEKELVLSGFNMTMPLGGYIALEQTNGQFSPDVISAYGDEGQSVFGFSRINVPGSLLRVAVPRGAGDTLFGDFQRLLVFLLGALLLTFGVIKRQRALHPVAELKEDPTALEEFAVKKKAALDKPPGEEDTGSGTGRDAGEEAVLPEPQLQDVSLPDTTNIDQRRREARSHETPVELSPEIFRAYDIRGVVGKTLDNGIARQVGQAIGTLAMEQDATPVVVGRDGRHSGPDLVRGMIEGLSSTGCDVVDIGAVPTGVLYYAAHEAGSGSGVMVTGSHNPPDYNGIKAMVGGTTLAGDSITALYDCLQSGELRVGKGQVSKQDILKAYRERIAGDIRLQRPLKVVVDCGNGIGGICAADILRSIGAEVLPMFDEVDGSFPNHHPDPSEPENLKDLISTVDLMEADLGVAFDGDADRLGVVTPSGEIVYADRIMMLFAREILSRNPGARIIYDVKCTGKLEGVIRDAGGEPEMYKTGHSLIKNRMKEVDAPFAGEMSGHFFFGDRWYGFDCGIYSAARLLEILARDERTPEQVLNSLPNDINTPEPKVHMQEGENHAFIEEFQDKARFLDARISTIDGLRADFEYGWGLVRASNTTPILVVRFEADCEESMDIIKEAFRMQMRSIKPDLELPF
jgi:phosphomannomutase